MDGLRGNGVLKEVLIVAGLMVAQVIYAFYVLVLNRMLTLGVDPLSLVILGSLLTSVLLAPFAVALERKKWPARLSLGLIARFVLIALGGITALQALMLLGIKKTSPAIASAMPNLAPGFTFIIASCLRFEKFDIRCKYSRAKIFGTLVCLGGAVTMSFLQSPPSSPGVRAIAVDATINKDWIIGCFYLLAGIVIASCTAVLQASTMVNFSAPFSLCVITSLMGSALTALLKIIMEGKLGFGSPTISMSIIVAVVLGGGVVTTACIAFHTWCINEKGPVLVSIFSPIQTVCSALLSAIFLKQVISLGSLVGMVVMFIGLHMVLWAKKKEVCDLLNGDDVTTLLIDDVEKPLLS